MMDFEKDLERLIYLNIEDYFDDFIKEDNIECCICLESNWGVKLPKCNHFICPKCYYKLYYGFITDDFYKNNSYPNYPKMPEKPLYPYLNPDENLQIYIKLSNNDDLKEWFIEQQEDLYECYKSNNIEIANINIKEWFDTNEIIKKYEDNILSYNVEFKKYQDNYVLYQKQLENYEIRKIKERINNCKKSCPLCRA